MLRKEAKPFLRVLIACFSSLAHPAFLFQPLASSLLTLTLTLTLACNLATAMTPSIVANHDIRAELEREEQLDLVDPLRHFLAIDGDDDDQRSSCSNSNDIRDLPSSTNYSIVPQQLESIIDRRTTIRYYSDLSRSPILLEDAVAEAGSWDIHLKLDMTTGCGGKIWPAAEVLGAYIAAKYSAPSTANQASSNTGYNNHKFDWRNKTIVELGSGTGLVGFLVHALRLANTQIYVTDQTAMLPLMRDNLSLNFPLSATHPSRSQPHTWDDTSFVQVLHLDWCTPPPTLRPDVLLLADCVYLESAFQPLIDTLLTLSTVDTEILFCYQKRRKADKRFFALLKRSFVFHDVDDDHEARMREYRRQGTQLLRIRRK